ncbi:MAG: ABC transporter substrate-binding protein [Aggregatilineales bacterium]
MMKKLLILSLLVLLVGSMGLAQDEKVLVIGHAESTDSLDPANGFTQTTGVINRVTYDTLVTFPDDNAASIEPMLAESWEISEDGTEYTFSLREDIIFHDGSPMTASDVVFSINRLKNLNGNPSFLADGIDSVEAMDDYTVVFTLPSNRPSFLAEMTNYAFSVSSQALVEANGGTSADDAAEADSAESFLNGLSVGTGPYILDLWEPQQRTELIVNPNFWGDAPYFDRVIIVNIPEAAAQSQALVAGDIDIALDLSAEQVNALEGNDDITLTRNPSQLVHFILMNEDEEIGGPFSDPLVQEAVRLGLDYNGYVDLWGGVVPGTNMSAILPGAYSSEDGTAMVRDVDRAMELLAEAGYPDGLEVTLDYPDFTFQGVNMNTNAQKIQSDLADIGITVTIAPAELQVSLDEYRNGQQGFSYWFWGPDILDSADFLSFLPGGKVAEERLNWNADGADADLLDLIDAARTAVDQDERMALYGELQDYAQCCGPYAPFNQPAVQYAVGSDIENFIWHPQWLLDVSILSRSE